MTDPDPDRPEPEVSPAEAPATEVRRRIRRPAPASDVKAYVPPVDVPENLDEMRRTRELSRVQISPELDPRRKLTVKRVMPPTDYVPQPPVAPPFEETAPLGTNLRAIAEASGHAHKGTVRMNVAESVASPSPVLRAPSQPAPDEVHVGPRGTMWMKPRQRGGTRMMKAGVDDPELASARAVRRVGASRRNAARIQVAVVGGLIVVGLLALAVFGGRRAPSSGDAAAPSTPSGSPAAAQPSPPPVAAPPAAAPADTARAAPPAEAPSTSPSATPRGRSRAKTPARRGDGAAAPASPQPMFEREDR